MPARYMTACVAAQELIEALKSRDIECMLFGRTYLIFLKFTFLVIIFTIYLPFNS